MHKHYLLGLIASAGAASAFLLAPVASADPADEVSNQPACTSVGGGGETGTGTTTCQTPGNVQISATAPDVPAYVYPWDDEFYGSALIMGPGEGNRGGYGGGGFGGGGEGGGGGGGGRR